MSFLSRSSLSRTIDIQSAKKSGKIISLETACVILNIETPHQDFERRYVLKKFLDLIKKSWTTNLNCHIHLDSHILMWSPNEELPLTYKPTPDHIIHSSTIATSRTLKSQMTKQLTSAKKLIEQNTLRFPDDFIKRYGDSFLDTQTEEVVRKFVDNPFPTSPMARFQGDPYAPFPENPSQTYLEAFKVRLYEVATELGYEPDPVCGITKCPSPDELITYEDAYAGFRRFSEYFEDPARQSNVPTLDIHTMKLIPSKASRGWNRQKVALSGRVALAFTLGMVPFKGASLSNAIKAVQRAVQIVCSYKKSEKSGLIVNSNTMRGMIVQQLEGVINSLNLGNPNVIIKKLPILLDHEDEDTGEDTEPEVKIDGERDEDLVEYLIDKGVEDDLRKEIEAKIESESESEPSNEPSVVSDDVDTEPTTPVNLPVVSVAQPKVSVRRRHREIGNTEDIADDLLLSQYNFIMRELCAKDSRDRNKHLATA